MQHCATFHRVLKTRLTVVDRAQISLQLQIVPIPFRLLLYLSFYALYCIAVTSRICLLGICSLALPLHPTRTNSTLIFPPSILLCLIVYCSDLVYLSSYWICPVPPFISKQFQFHPGYSFVHLTIPLCLRLWCIVVSSRTCLLSKYSLSLPLPQKVLISPWVFLRLSLYSSVSSITVSHSNLAYLSPWYV